MEDIVSDNHCWNNDNKPNSEIIQLIETDNELVCSTDAEVIAALRKCFLSSSISLMPKIKLLFNIYVVITNTEDCLIDWVERLQYVINYATNVNTTDKNNFFCKVSTRFMSVNEYNSTESTFADHLDNGIDNHVIYFFFAVSRMPASIKFPKSFVYIQTERIDSYHFAAQASVRALYDATEIWDYSFANIKQGSSRYLIHNWHYVPFPASYYNPRSQYAPFADIIKASKTRSLPSHHRDIHVLFVGTYSARRNQFLTKLANELQKRTDQLNFVVRWNGVVKHNELMSLYMRSRIVLNIHYENSSLVDQPVEMARITPALELGAMVLSEFSDTMDMHASDSLFQSVLVASNALVTSNKKKQQKFDSLKFISFDDMYSFVNEIMKAYDNKF